MLYFVTGKNGKENSSFLHSVIARKVKEENKEIILIVPKQYTFQSDTDILDALGPKDACNVEVLSFSRLASVVLKTCKGIKKPPLEEGANAVIMSVALESIRDRLSFFSRHISGIAFIRKMLEEIKGFKNNGITPEELLSASRRLPEGLLRQKTEETALIYETYNTLLARSFYDDNDLLSIVYETLLENTFFENKVVFIDGFSSFSVQELKIVSVMLRDAEDVYVSLISDNIKSTDMSSPFAVSNEAARRLINESVKMNVPVSDEALTSEEAPRRKELCYLRDNLYKSTFLPFKEEVNAVKILCAKDLRDECDSAARKIKSLMRTEEYRCRDIAVIYRDGIYEKEIRHSFKKYGIPHFEDRRQPVENEPLVVLVRALFDVCEKGLSTDLIMRILKTGLFHTDADSIASLENYALMWSLTGKDWEKEFTFNPDGFGIEMNDKRKEALSLLEALREKIVTPVVLFKDSIKGKTGKEIMTLLYKFLIEEKINESLKEYAISLEESGNFELAKEQEQVWDILMSVINKIAEVTESIYLSPKRTGEIFDLVVSTESLGKLPDGFDEVTVCGAERVSTLSKRVVFVLGANEGVFPKTSSDKGIFPEREKERLREFIPEMRDSVRLSVMKERFMAYTALTAATEGLYVTFGLTDLMGAKLEESEIVRLIRKILPLTKEEDMTKESLEDLIESEKSAFEIMARLYNERSERAEALRRFFEGKEEYKGRMEALKRLCDKKDFEFRNEKTAVELFGKNIRLSASRLEDYELCPFKYFLKHEIRAKERIVARLDPAQSGTLVHYVLENLLSKYNGKSFLSVSKEELLRETEKLLEGYIEAYMGGIEGKSRRFSYLYNRSLKILSTIIDRLLFEFSDSDFEPCDFELEIDREGKIKPFKVELENGYIELRGIVDRVDKMDKNGKRYLRVVDYKTGKKSFSLSDVLGGLGMQMVLYLVSIWRNGKDYYGDNIVPAGVLYLPARFEPYNINRKDSEDAVKMKRLESGKMDGIILDDGDVIKGMNRSLDGVMIPISVNKSGGIKGNFISLGNLEKLAEIMDNIMAEMGNELHKGRVPAKPAFGKDHGTTCDFCDYRSVCKRTEGVKYRYIEKLNHTESLEKLERGEGNGTTVDFTAEERH